jgi:hypothetical protein
MHSEFQLESFKGRIQPGVLGGVERIILRLE